MVQTSDQSGSAQPRSERDRAGSRPGAVDGRSGAARSASGTSPDVATQGPTPVPSQPAGPPERATTPVPTEPGGPAPAEPAGPAPTQAGRRRGPVGAVRGVSAPRPARRTKVVVRKVSPLSVLKFSLLFYLCLMLIVLFAFTIVYIVLSAAGAIDSLEQVLGYIFGTGTTSNGGAEPIQIDGRSVFTWSLLGGLVFVAIWSVINVFIALLYNLISDIVGGVEVTLSDKPHQ